MKLEQFTNCLPTEIHRWVVEKRPKPLVDAAKLADEYAVLYKPFHAEQDNSWKSDDRNFSDKPEKIFHKNGDRGTFHQKYHHKGNNYHKTAVPVTKHWAQEVLCIRCGRGGHTASVCYAKKPFVHPQTQMQNTAFDAAAKPISLVTKHQNLQLCREDQGLVHKNLAPFCVNATLCTNKGSRRPVVLLRDSGALQSLVSKKCLAAGDYVDTLEYRLIQGILGQPTEVPLVEVSIESDKLSGTILCGLVENLPHGIDFLIGHDLQEELPLSLVMRARTYTTVRNAAVTSNSDPNDSNNNVHLHPMIHTDDGEMNDIVLTDDLPNDNGPASTLIHDIGEDVTNENVIIQEQSELNSNASDFADTALQEEHDDFGNLFDEV